MKCPVCGYDSIVTRRAYASDRDNQIAKMADGTLTRRQIAEALDMPYASIVVFINRMRRDGRRGLKFASRYNHDAKSWEERYRSIVRERERGHTLARIGERYGISRERVRQIVAKAKRRGLTASM